VNAAVAAAGQPAADRPAAAESGVAGLYAASYARLVGVLTVATGSRPDAEEVVQEAFARLLPRWSTVGTYDDPEAWVRAVAFRLSASRWRRARVAARALSRIGAAPDVEPPDGSRLDAERVLAGLPRAFREVLVLHHALGLPVEQVAAELRVPVGTVKSRLSRARAAAAALGGDQHE
jgi:RNA polymerase sigma-70 factor (ECF subfamily)